MAAVAVAGRGDVAVAGEGRPHEGRIPWARASYEYVESFFTDAITLATSTLEQTPKNVLPGGFLRGIWLRFVLTGGTLGSATLAADFPWITINTIVLEDINGAPIVGPLTGYELYLINKYGGYFFQGAPEVDPAATLTVNADFWLYVPAEFRSDGLGSLANTDARSQYRLRYTAESTANYIGSTVTGWTAPTVMTVRGYVETWAQVEPTDVHGQPQEQQPPGLGTTGFWVHENPIISNAALSVKHTRVGSPIRNIIYVMRTNAAQGAAVQATPRSDLIAANDVVRLRLDNRYLRIESINLRQRIMTTQYALQVTDFLRETGVLVFPMSEDLSRHPAPGDESNYLLTTPASYLAVEATFTAAGTLSIITNDIAFRGHVPMPSETA